LSAKGRREAKAAGRLLVKEGYDFDLTFTSYLKRAILTLDLTLEAMDRLWLPVVRHWRLNERHYGALQGLNKAETASRHGAKQVAIWRRSYDIPPPALDPADPATPARPALSRPESGPAPGNGEPRRRGGPHAALLVRLHRPALRSGRRVLVSAHGNSLRALVKHLDGISDEDIPGLNIPTGIPLVYELDGDLAAVDRYYLGDRKPPRAAARAVAEQAQRKV